MFNFKSQINLFMKSPIQFLILTITFLFYSVPVEAGGDCGSLTIEVTFHSNSGYKFSGMMDFNEVFRMHEKMYSSTGVNDYWVGEYLNDSLIKKDLLKSEVDFENVKILSISKQILLDSSLKTRGTESFTAKFNDIIEVTKGYNHKEFTTQGLGYFGGLVNGKIDFNSYGDSRVMLDFGESKLLNLDTIQLITVDSISICTDIFDFRVLNKDHVHFLKSKQPEYSLSIEFDFDGFLFLDFLVYDKEWPKERLLKALNNPETIALIKKSSENFFALLLSFPIDLQRAILNGKVQLFTGSGGC